MPLALVSQLRLVASRTPGAVAIIEESGHAVSFGDLLANVERIHHGLAAHGMRSGDRVLFAIRPGAVAIAAMLAMSELGAVIVVAQLGVGDALFAAQMHAVRPTWVMAESVLIAAMRSPMVRRLLELRGKSLPSLASLDHARFVASGPWMPGLRGALRLQDLERDTSGVAAEPTPGGLPGLEDTSDAFIVFTSGTTDAPKAVVHSRASLAAALQVVGTLLAIAPGDRLWTREVHVLLPALFAGATSFLPRSELDPGRTLAAIREHGISHVFEVTANVERLVEHVERRGAMLPPTLRQVMIGAAPVRQAFFRRLRKVLPAGAQAWCVYGMTEILPIAAIAIDEKLAFRGEGDIVGRPVDGVRVDVSPQGELIVRGPQLFSGYLGGALVSSHPTGDLAKLDDGRIVLMGRAKDMIIRREHNIYPELHEPVIEQIAGVRRCAMVGLYDEERADERVVLVVEPERALESVRERQEFIARVRTELERGPHRIDDAALPDAILVAELPYTGRSHKVDKRALREMALQELS